MSLQDPVGFSSDRPISSQSSDILNRGQFAQTLAERLRKWEGEESLVLALMGEWGCGKTSLKNLVREKIQMDEASVISVIEFCPWELSQHLSLTETFLNALAEHLGMKDDETSRRASKRIRLYSSALGFGGDIARAIGGTLVHSGQTFGAAIAAGGLALSTTSRALAQAAEVSNHFSKQPETIVTIKENLVAAMQALDEPILVVIDDIDRLTSAEIREVFQLIKANANLPNLIYLMLFDREVVVRALNAWSDNDGDRYLEKIVQVPLNIPAPDLPALHQALFKRLDRILETKSIATRWDTGRWLDYWNNGLADYFQNLRSVYRFISSFEFHASIMITPSTSEVDPLDLLVLEALRVFEPRLYDDLPKHRSVLVGINKIFHSDRWEGKAGRTEAALLLQVEERNRQRVSQLIRMLFPALTGSDSDREDIRRCRVGTEEFFDRYFSLSLRSTEVSEEIVTLLRNCLSKPEAFKNICDKLNQQNKLKTAFQRLDAYNDQISKEELPSALLSLIEAADLDDGKEPIGLFELDLCSLVWRQIYFSLRRIEDIEDRFLILKESLSKGNGLLIPVKIAQYETRDDDKDNSYLVSDEHSVKLRKIALDRIEEFAAQGKLRELKRIAWVLYCWSDWSGSIEAPRKWINHELQGPSDALWILGQFLQTKSTTTNLTYYTRYILLDELKKFAEIDKLKEFSCDLSIEKLSGDEGRALRAFRYALEWRKQGKPGDYTGPDSPDKNPLVDYT